jgi:arylsulfatase A-like enzyme
MLLKLDIINKLTLFLVVCFCVASSHAEQEGYSVLWITGESLRASALHCYGNPLPTSPNVDALARRGVLFRECINASGWTSESMVSNLLSLYSPVHGVVTRGRHIPPAWYTPLEYLGDAGYAIPRMQLVQMNINYMHLGFNHKEASFISPAQWLRRHKKQHGKQPFFLWYHLENSHLPYNAPPGHKELFWSDSLIPNASAGERIRAVREQNIIPAGSVKFQRDEDLAAIAALYAGEVHWIDSEFGAIMKALDQLGLRERTIVVFSSDHGEEMLEHGNVGHSSTLRGGHLYDEILRVPLIVSCPGLLPEGLVKDAPVSSLDVMPTLLELLGMSGNMKLQGESLTPMIKGRSTARTLPLFSFSSYRGYQEPDPTRVVDCIRVARDERYKLISTLREGAAESFQLFDLNNDPGEMQDAQAQHPDEYDKFVKCLQSKITASASWPVSKERMLSPAAAAINPRLISPTPETQIVLKASGSVVQLEWTGDAKTEYLLEFHFGQTASKSTHKLPGDSRESESGKEYHFGSCITVKGNQTTLSFDKQFQKVCIPIFEYLRIRLKRKHTNEDWSPWLVYGLR